MRGPTTGDIHGKLGVRAGSTGWISLDDVGRYLRNAKGACIYEGTSQIHQLMQADYALGYRKDRPLRCEFPAYDPEEWQ